MTEVRFDAKEESVATVFVIGAGPAGLFTAQKMALAGHEVVIFNRDIKPGGLAEYGIYPLKDKMKNGLRKQFAKVLALPSVHYFGHVSVGMNSPITIDTLRELSPAAMVFAVGAQGTKRLGVPGESCRGVYSAKDFVYHYNRLPPFATQDFSVGKRTAIIGMGNVMVDVARWLLHDDPLRRTEQVIVVARRGPFEAKFDEKEFAHIQMYLDRNLFLDELHRIQPRVAGIGQDVAKVPEETFPCLAKYPEHEAQGGLTFRFLSSPLAVIPASHGRVTRLRLADNVLTERDGRIVAEATDATAELDVDTIIFAVGDSHDPDLGLPFGANGYVTNPNPADPSSKYAVFDPKSGQCLEGVYVVGWARKPSEGLVGIARHDGESGATYVLEYLSRSQTRRSASADDVAQFLWRRGIQFFPKDALSSLEAAEQREAGLRNLLSFKFDDDAAMLSAIEGEKSACAPQAMAQAASPAQQSS
jgi:ferredoxin/flavodoxin---NADP+ reductase